MSQHSVRQSLRDAVSTTMQLYGLDLPLDLDQLRTAGDTVEVFDTADFTTRTLCQLSHRAKTTHIVTPSSDTGKFGLTAAVCIYSALEATSADPESLRCSNASELQRMRRYNPGLVTSNPIRPAGTTMRPSIIVITPAVAKGEQLANEIVTKISEKALPLHLATAFIAGALHSRTDFLGHYCVTGIIIATPVALLDLFATEQLSLDEVDLVCWSDIDLTTDSDFLHVSRPPFELTDLLRGKSAEFRTLMSTSSETQQSKDLERMRQFALQMNMDNCTGDALVLKSPELVHAGANTTRNATAWSDQLLCGHTKTDPQDDFTLPRLSYVTLLTWERRLPRSMRDIDVQLARLSGKISEVSTLSGPCCTGIILIVPVLASDTNVREDLACFLPVRRPRCELPSW